MEKISLHLPLMALLILAHIRRQIALLNIGPSDRALAALLLRLGLLGQEDLYRWRTLTLQAHLAPLSLERRLVHLSPAQLQLLLPLEFQLLVLVEIEGLVEREVRGEGVDALLGQGAREAARCD